MSAHFVGTKVTYRRAGTEAGGESVTCFHGESGVVLIKHNNVHILWRKCLAFWSVNKPYVDFFDKTQC